MDKNRLKLIGISLFSLALVIIGLQNTDPVYTRILFFTVTMPRVVLLLITALLGFIIGVLFSLHFLDKPGRREKTKNR